MNLYNLLINLPIYCTMIFLIRRVSQLPARQFDNLPGKIRHNTHDEKTDKERQFKKIFVRSKRKFFEFRKKSETTTKFSTKPAPRIITP